MCGSASGGKRQVDRTPSQFETLQKGYRIMSSSQKLPCLFTPNGVNSARVYSAKVEFKDSISPITSVTELKIETDGSQTEQTSSDADISMQDRPVHSQPLNA